MLSPRARLIMAGSIDHPRDLESGVAQSQANPEAIATRGPRAASPTKIRASTDARATSTVPSSTDDSLMQNEATATSRPTDYLLLEKLKGRIPSTVQKPSRKVGSYLKGPEPPRIWKIRPILPRVQQLPLRLVNKLCPRQWQRIVALFLFYVCWIATFGAVLHKSSVADDVNGYGQPIRVSCGGVFWYVLPEKEIPPAPPPTTVYSCSNVHIGPRTTTVASTVHPVCLLTPARSRFAALRVVSAKRF